MAGTVSSPSARPRDVLSVLAAPVVRGEGTRIVVVVCGEADGSSRHVLSDVLSRVIASHEGDVVIDLCEAEFIDSATVRVFAVGQQLLDDRGRKLTFRSPTRLATRMLHLFGLADLIEAREPAGL